MSSPEASPHAAAPRWLFRGRDGAWDALAASIMEDPTRPVDWPIAPSGPSMAVGDAVLLWRTGRGGGIAARCTVVDEPLARPRPDGPPEVVVALRIDRAFHHPVAPATLARDPLLRPLAFMDLLDETERRVSPAQEEALAALLAARDADGDTDPDDVRSEARTSVPVPVRLLPLVEELLVALGADEPAPAPTAPARPAAPQRADASTSGTPTDDAPTVPTDLQVAQAEALARAHGAATFTVDDAAGVWRTGVGTARSRVDRLVESGLMVRAGTLRPEDRPGVRPARGRPPVLYRMAAG